MIVALNRFISKLAERCLPFIQILKQLKNFQWSEECQKKIEDLKGYLSSTPLLGKLDMDEKLFLYLATSPMAMGAMLI